VTAVTAADNRPRKKARQDISSREGGEVEAAGARGLQGPDAGVGAGAGDAEEDVVAGMSRPASKREAHDAAAIAKSDGAKAAHDAAAVGDGGQAARVLSTDQREGGNAGEGSSHAYSSHMETCLDGDTGALLSRLSGIAEGLSELGGAVGGGKGGQTQAPGIGMAAAGGDEGSGMVMTEGELAQALLSLPVSGFGAVVHQANSETEAHAAAAAETTAAHATAAAGRGEAANGGRAVPAGVDVYYGSGNSIMDEQQHQQQLQHEGAVGEDLSAAAGEAEEAPQQEQQMYVGRRRSRKRSSSSGA
jgi:hypothetical protein